jgi:signal transduction histidine kinase/CheY-like chemotaxis protein/HPt (histidine-containing phosphotransfer) domain-containing protein
MFKPAYRLSFSTPDTETNMLFVAAMGCTTLQIALTAIWSGWLGDVVSILAGFAITVLLVCRLLAIVFSVDATRDDLTITVAMLAWSIWMAYCHQQTALWLPAMLAAVFSAPRSAIAPTLAFGVASTAAGAALAGADAMHVCNVLILALTTGAGVALHRTTIERREARAYLRIQRLEASFDTAALGYLELDDGGKISHLLGRLLLAPEPSAGQDSRGRTRDVGSTQLMSAWRMLDLFHPDDHLVAARAQQFAISERSDADASDASCECRLLRPDGTTIWVRAHFSRTAPPGRGSVATLVDIGECKRLRHALDVSHARLEAQEQELALHFEASKKALHARQEVERLAQHDLKSPLKSIAASASALRDGGTLSASEDALLTSIERTAGRALAIVSMSLDLYRMEEGTYRFVPEQIDMEDIARRVIEDMSHHARTKHVRLEFRRRTPASPASGNHVFVTSIVENLVRNAVEAAPEHSTVWLALRDVDRVELLIHNEGTVPAAIRESFFEKYVTHGKRDGLGLGTYSARLIARAQGGELHMSSSEIHGTTLTLELEKSAPSGAQSSITEAGSFDTMQNQSADDQGDRPPIDLLVVEDDEHNWLLLTSWLPSSVRARRAINGRDAIDALVERRPELILMDLEMPVMDGFEAAWQIREMQALAGESPSAIFAFTGHDDPETHRRIALAGFDGVLPKPVKRSVFESLVASRCSKALSTPAAGVRIEKQFADAFPDFIASRRALVDDIERFAAAGDMTTARRAAHTLAGSPAMHGFESGIEICRSIIASDDPVDPAWLARQVATLSELLAHPIVS